MVHPQDEDARRSSPDPGDRWSVAGRLRAAKVASARHQQLLEGIEDRPAEVRRLARRQARGAAPDGDVTAPPTFLTRVLLVGLVATFACGGGLYAATHGYNVGLGVIAGGLLGVGGYRFLRKTDYTDVAIWAVLAVGVLGFALLVELAVR